MALTATLNISSAPSLIASKVIQDLTYTAQSPGAAGNATTIAYIGDGTAGSETVGVVGSAISVHMDPTPVTGSTATQIKAAVDASSPAHALVSVAVSGTGSNVQTTQSATHLAGGFDTAISVSQNQPIPVQIAISNSGGSAVTVDSIYPRVSSPTPDPAFLVSDPILPQPISIAPSATAYVPFKFIVYGTESGHYVLNVDVCSTSSNLLATPPIAATFTL